MTLRRVEPGQARLLALAVEYDFPKRTADWLDHLAKGELTEEMQNVFEAFGYLEKRARRQSRPKVGTVPRTEADINAALDEALAQQDINAAIDKIRAQQAEQESGMAQRGADNGYGDEPVRGEFPWDEGKRQGSVPWDDGEPAPRPEPLDSEAPY